MKDALISSRKFDLNLTVCQEGSSCVSPNYFLQWGSLCPRLSLLVSACCLCQD